MSDELAKAKAPPSDVDKTLAELEAAIAANLTDQFEERLRGYVRVIRSHIASLVKERDDLLKERDQWDRRVAYDELAAREYENRATQQRQIDALTLRSEAAQAEAARMREALKDLLETAVEPDTDSELYHCNLKRKAARAALNPETPANG